MNTRILAEPKRKAISVPPVRSNLLQPKCACGGTAGPTGQWEECRVKWLQGKIANPKSEIRNDSLAPPIVHEVLAESGQPLNADTRSLMQSRFGHDFSRVRIHTDAKAAESARAVNALAYTVGRNVVFGAGQYEPQSIGGRELIAHELAHVTQHEQGLSSSAPCETASGVRMRARKGTAGPALQLQRFPDTQSTPPREALPPPESDSELEALTPTEIERRARNLNNPYRPENAVRLLRLANAWEKKQNLSLAGSESTDPLLGLPLAVIFGDLNTLANDAARYPVPSRPHRRPSTRPRRLPFSEAKAERSTIKRPSPSPTAPLLSETPKKEISREVGRMLAPSSEAPEYVVTGVHGLGTFMPEEPLGLGLGGLGLHAVAMFAHYALTLIKAVEQKRLAGELIGLRVSLVTLSTLKELGRLEIDAGTLYKKIFATGKTTHDWDPDPSKFAGGPAEQEEFYRARERAIVFVIMAFIKANEEAKEEYDRIFFSAPPLVTGEESAWLLRMERSRTIKQREIFMENGILFKDRAADMRLLPSVVLRTLLKAIGPEVSGEAAAKRLFE
jgi:Domain of unknown function (DUF4157)